MRSESGSRWSKKTKKEEIAEQRNVVIEMCQNTKCTTICCLYLCIAVHCQNKQQWVCKHQEQTTNQWNKVSWSNKPLFCPWCGRLGPCAWITLEIESTWQELKPAKACWCFGQCSASPATDGILIRITYLIIGADHVKPFMEMIYHLWSLSAGKRKIGSGIAWGVDLLSKLPRLQSKTVLGL